jgi:hypothetical protein
MPVRISLLARLPRRIKVPLLFGFGIASFWMALSIVTVYLNNRFDASLVPSDLPLLALAFGGMLSKPAMPKHCPTAVDDGGLSGSYKARTYDTHIIMNRNEFGSRNQNTLHKLSKWKGYSAEEWRSSVVRVADRLKVYDGARVYEIGVGVGSWLLPLQIKYKNLQLAGSDLSAQAVVIANNVLGAHFCYANAYDLSYASSDYYDFVTSYAVFYIAAASEADTINLVKQAVRLLKPGTGQLFVGYNSVHLPGAPPTGDGRINLRQEFWSENAAKLGLTNVQIVIPTSLGGSTIKYDVYATRAANGTSQTGG